VNKLDKLILWINEWLVPIDATEKQRNDRLWEVGASIGMIFCFLFVIVPIMACTSVNSEKKQIRQRIITSTITANNEHEAKKIAKTFYKNGWDKVRINGKMVTAIEYCE